MRTGLRLDCGWTLVRSERQRVRACGRQGETVDGDVAEERLGVQLLGPLVVRRGEQLVGPAGAKARGLLALLALQPNRVWSTAELIDAMWGDAPPASAVNLVQTYVSDWRRALDPGSPRGGGRGGRITRVGGGYRLRLSPGECDVGQFRELTEQARAATRRGDSSKAASLFEAALQLWSGPVALADLTGEPWHEGVAERLAAERLQAVEQWAEAALTADTLDPGRVEAVLATVEDAHPLSERLVELRMWALCRQGRQADALAVHERMRRRLADDLGIDPGPGLTSMQARVLRQDPVLAPRQRDGQAAGLLVPLDRFLGRLEELNEVRRLLSSARLVTLTGPGGSGKTRLALEVAASMRSAADDGGRQVVVEGTSLTEATHLPARLADALGLPPDAERSMADQVAAHVGGGRLLIVLDNLEHLPGAGEVLMPLLQSAPGVRLLVTSRQALRVRGERVFPVGPLAVEPRGDGLPAAVELFLDRAAAVDPRTAANCDVSLAEQICRRLDGLPLAIELAASWTAVLPPADLLSRLAEPLAVPGPVGHDRPDRHRTLRATIDWSHRLLCPDEQTLFADLSIFPGGADLDALTAVSGTALTQPLLTVVANLVQHSLLRPLPGQTARFGMLNTIAAYASDRLEESGRRADVHNRHADHYAALAEQLSRHGASRDDGPHWHARMRPELDNIRVAIDWLLAAEQSDRALQMTADCFTLWWGLHSREGLARLRAALAHASAAAVARPIGLVFAGTLAATLGELNGEHDIRTGAELAHQRGDVRVQALALLSLGSVCRVRDREQARAALERALELNRQAEGQPVRYGVTAPMMIVGYAAAIYSDLLRSLDLSRSQRWAEEALRIARQEGLTVETARELTDLGTIALLRGDPTAAEPPLREGDRTLEQAGAHHYRDHTLHGLAQLAHQRGDLAAAEAHVRSALQVDRELDPGVRAYYLTQLVDILIDAGRLHDAADALDQTGHQPQLSADIRASVLVRQARLARLTQQPNEASTSLLQEADDLLPAAELPSARLIWYVEAAYASARADDPEQAARLLDRLSQHARDVGQVLPPQEQRRLSHLRERLPSVVRPGASARGTPVNWVRSLDPGGSGAQS